VDPPRPGSEDACPDLRDLRHRPGRTPELKLHLRFARNQGWTEDELAEALLHLAGYVGAPLVREAMLTACETFTEMRAEG
jgi:4-carboxymuconolactone decarboxylase